MHPRINKFKGKLDIVRRYKMGFFEDHTWSDWPSWPHQPEVQTFKDVRLLMWPHQVNDQVNVVQMPNCDDDDIIIGISTRSSLHLLREREYFQIPVSIVLAWIGRLIPEMIYFVTVLARFQHYTDVYSCKLMGCECCHEKRRNAMVWPDNRCRAVPHLMRQATTVYDASGRECTPERLIGFIHACTVHGLLPWPTYVHYLAE